MVISFNKRVTAIILVVCVLLSVSACYSRSGETVDFFAMDTYMSITAYGKNAKDAAYEAEGKIKGLSEELDVTEPDSWLSLYNAGLAGTVSKDMDEIITAANKAAELTGGAFDVHIYPVVVAWGFLSGDYRVPDSAELDTLLADKSMYDFGGIAKGYAADAAAEIMRQHEMKSALITLGGNIYAVGKNTNGKPWRIAVQDPFDMLGYAGILELTDTSAVTSGGYQRFFEQDGVVYHHIIDPRTGYPAESGLVSVTVVSKNSALADGLSTGLFILGQYHALEIWRENKELFDLVLIADNGNITITAGLDGKFESKNDYTVAV